MSKDGKMIEQIRKNSISINKLNEFAETVKKSGVTAEKFSSFFDESKELADKICSEISTKRKDECIIVSGKLSFCSHVDKKYNYKEKDLIARKVLEGGFYYCEMCGKTINGDVGTNEWIDLDESAPISIILDMDKYHIQLLSADENWVDTEIKDELDLLAKLIPEFVKYRYRLKPLKSIRISQNELEILCDYYENQEHRDLSDDVEFIEEKIGRKVELI